MAARFTPDPNNTPRFAPDEAARFDALSDEEAEAAALADPDAQPLTNEQLDRGVSSRRIRLVRQSTGLSQAQFAARYHVNQRRLQDLEQGRFEADSALLAYLRVIELEREAVDRALETA